MLSHLASLLLSVYLVSFLIIFLHVFLVVLVLFCPLHASRTKLTPRSVMSIFLGYGEGQKGYWCYDPINKKFCLSSWVLLLFLLVFTLCFKRILFTNIIFLMMFHLNHKLMIYHFWYYPTYHPYVLSQVQSCYFYQFSSAPSITCFIRLFGRGSCSLSVSFPNP